MKWNSFLFLFFFFSCDDGAICTHKPPRKSNNVAQGSIVSDDNSDSSARNSDEKIERLENENDYLKRVTAFATKLDYLRIKFKRKA